MDITCAVVELGGGGGGGEGLGEGWGQKCDIHFTFTRLAPLQIHCAWQ